MEIDLSLIYKQLDSYRDIATRKVTTYMPDHAEYARRCGRLEACTEIKKIIEDAVAELIRKGELELDEN